MKVALLDSAVVQEVQRHQQCINRKAKDSSCRCLRFELLAVGGKTDGSGR